MHTQHSRALICWFVTQISQGATLSLILSHNDPIKYRVCFDTKLEVLLRGSESFPARKKALYFQ